MATFDGVRSRFWGYVGGQLQTFGGFATGNAVFLVRAQDDVFLDDLGGLKLIAKKSCQIARNLNLKRYDLCHLCIHHRRS